MKPQHSFTKNALGVKINENSATHMNQYLKMFSVDMSSVQYKTDQVLFRVTSVQGPSIDEIYNLTIYKNSNSLGITIVELEQVKSFESDNSANLIAVLESTNTVSVYLKMTNTTITTALKILSFQKYGPEKLTIYSEQYVDSLPSGTQYPADNIKTETFNLNTNYSFVNNSISSPYLRKKNQTVKANFIVNCSNNVPTTDTVIGNLPSGFRPTSNQVIPVFLGLALDNGWTFIGVGWGLIETNGNIHIRNANSTTYKFAMINATYFTHN